MDGERVVSSCNRGHKNIRETGEAIPKMIKYSVIPIGESKLSSGTMDNYRGGMEQKRGRTSMDNIHCPHRTTGVVEDPFLVQVQVRVGDLLAQLGDDEVHHRASVIAMSGNGALRQVVQVGGIEDVELLQARVQVAVETSEKGQEGHGEASAAHDDELFREGKQLTGKTGAAEKLMEGGEGGGKGVGRRRREEGIEEG